MVQIKRSVNDAVSEKTLEKYLKELRKSYNYSQEFVASQLNITRQTYSHYETGRITPPINSLYNLAKLYNISLDSFMDFSIGGYTNPVKSDSERTDETKKTVSDDEEIEEFLKYISTPENCKKYKALKRQEKLFLYYYQMLDDRDRKDILSFMKVKYQNRKTEQK